MAEVQIEIAGRSYRVACDDGQEARLTQLSRHLNNHVAGLTRELGEIGETRLMLLAALTVCDELYEARNKIIEMTEGGAPLDAETMGGASRVIEAAAARINAIAEKVA